MSDHVTPSTPRSELTETFQTVPAPVGSNAYGKNERYMVSGFSGAVVGQAAFVADGVQLSTFSGVAGNTGFSGANIVLLPHSVAGQSIVGFSGYSDTAKELKFVCNFKTGTSVATEIIWCGLQPFNSTPVVATNDDQIFYRYEAGVNNGCWQVIISRAGVDTTYSTSVAVTASTWYSLEFCLDAGRYVFASINDQVVAPSPMAPVTASVNMIPVLGVQDQFGTPRNVVVSKMYVGRSLS